MKYFDMNFIPQNTAPYGAKNITVFDNNGNKVGIVQLGMLRIPSNIGAKLYSYGVGADVHITYDTAEEDFQRALIYFNETVDFILLVGDLTVNGTLAELTRYKQLVETYSKDKEVEAIAGNHDASHTEGYTPVTLTKDGITPYTGRPLYYTFTKGNDVFVMVGQRRWDAYNGNNSDPFSTEELQWLYEVLEENRNKRCFVFQHMMRVDGCGNPHNLYAYDGLNNTQGTVFKSLMEHYKNVIWFHGHSHTKFDMQNEVEIANYDRLFGCHSIHVPSLSVPRDVVNGAYEKVYAESEGYVVDVYENHIVLRGRDFVKGEFLPIATYCIDTTLMNIPEKSFTDSTGTITI